MVLEFFTQFEQKVIYSCSPVSVIFPSSVIQNWIRNPQSHLLARKPTNMEIKNFIIIV